MQILIESQGNINITSIFANKARDQFYSQLKKLFHR